MSAEATRKIAKARIAMMFDTPFFGHLALNFILVEKNDMKMPTMATDGRHLFYDDNFVKQLSLDHLKFIIAHEIGHIIFMHIPRAMGRDPERWNEATDHVTNLAVMKDFPQYPNGLLMDPSYENKTADWVYNNLPEGDSGTGGSSGPKTVDGHDPWKDWGKGDQPGESGVEQEWREKIASAAMVAREKGTLSGAWESVIGEVMQPKLSWKALLRDMVTSTAKNDYRWNPPNKKMLHRGFILPGITGEELHLAVAIDTSGSVSDQLLAEFLAEVEGICGTYQTYTLYLYAADSVIQKQWELHEMDPIPKKMPGRGGTAFKPVFDDLKESAKDFSVLIYLTDLYGDQNQIPDPGFPVIWVTNGNEKAPFGTVIEIPK